MTTLDLFILSLLERGVTTPYSLLSRAGISLGASRPALQRLAGHGLIREMGQGPRGRREFKLTRAGEAEVANLDRYLDTAMSEQYRDRDSVLRLCCCALEMGRTPQAVQLLRKAAEECHERSRARRKELPDLPAGADLPKRYVYSMAVCEAARLETDARSFRTLAARFGKLPKSSQTRLRTPRKPNG